MILLLHTLGGRERPAQGAEGQGAGCSMVKPPRMPQGQGLWERHSFSNRESSRRLSFNRLRVTKPTQRLRRPLAFRP